MIYDQKMIKDLYQQELNIIYPEGMGEGDYIINICSRIYMPYVGYTFASFLFLDKDLIPLSIEMPKHGYDSPYTNKRFIIAKAIGLHNVFYHGGIPVKVSRDDLNTIAAVKVTWNTIYGDSHVITVTEIHNISFQESENHESERIYDLLINTLVDDSLSEEASYQHFSQFTDYCTFHIKPLTSGNIVSLPMSLETEDKLIEYLTGDEPVTNIHEQLAFDDINCIINHQVGTNLPADDYIMSKFILPGIDPISYIAGRKAHNYRLEIGWKEYILSPDLAPYNSFAEYLAYKYQDQ